jgi:hypothetical protein
LQVETKARCSTPACGEQRRGRRDVRGLVARGVDGGVPPAALERGEVGAAVADEVLGLAGEELVAVAAAVEHGHLVAARERLRRHVTPEEDRAAEDQEPHDAQRISCASSERLPTVRSGAQLAASQAVRLGSGSIGAPPDCQPGAGHSSKCRWQRTASP